MMDVARRDSKKRLRLTAILWGAGVLASVLAVQVYLEMTAQAAVISSEQFLQEVRKGNIAKLTVPTGRTTHQVHGELKAATTVTASGQAMSFKEFWVTYKEDKAALTELVSATNPGVAIASTPPRIDRGRQTIAYLPLAVALVALFSLSRQGLKLQTES